MPTKKPKYSSYLSKEDEDNLEAFCNEWQCSKAKALSILLRYWKENKNNQKLATNANSNDIKLSGLRKSISDIEDRLDQLEVAKNKLPNLDNLKQEVITDVLHQIELVTFSNSKDNHSKPETFKDTRKLIVEIMNDDKKTLSQRQLAVRFGYKSHKSVGEKFNSLSEEKFIAWTKTKDPEGKGWCKTEQGFEIVNH